MFLRVVSILLLLLTGTSLADAGDSESIRELVTRVGRARFKCAGVAG